MDLIDRVRSLGARLPKLEGRLETEEATKMALIVPFLAILGWDPYDPFEVIPEFTSDVGIKKGEKVDYAIMKDDHAVMIIEAKKAGVNLENEPASQLYRYFGVTKARVGILTDGIVYKFFSDLEEPNKMDERPFFEFSMRELDEHKVAELKRFTKDGFNTEETVSAAVELKYTNAIKQYLTQAAREPDEEIVKFLTGQVYTGRMTQAVRVQFTDIVKRALAGWVNDRVAARLKNALGDRGDDDGSATVASATSTSAEDQQTLPKGVVAVDGEVVTTQEEVDAHIIVKAIAAGHVAVDRVVMRDGKTYCSILLDDNNRKPIVRLHFNNLDNLRIGILDEDKKETRHSLETLEQLYDHAEAIRSTIKRYLD